jgi:hypothetical protein
MVLLNFVYVRHNCLVNVRTFNPSKQSGNYTVPPAVTLTKEPRQLMRCSDFSTDFKSEESFLYS